MSMESLLNSTPIASSINPVQQHKVQIAPAVLDNESNRHQSQRNSDIKVSRSGQVKIQQHDQRNRFQTKCAPKNDSRTLQRLITNNEIRVKIADLGNACFEVK